MVLRLKLPKFKPPPSKRTNLLTLLTTAHIGLGLIALVLLMRASGIFEILELLSLDLLLKNAGNETTDQRITLVSISTAEFFKEPSPNSLQYKDLASLLTKIIDYDPCVVGVDVVSNRLAGQDDQQIIQLFQQNANLIAVETLLSEQPDQPSPIAGHSDLNNQIGFNDLELDDDKNVRRAVLGFSDIGTSENFKFSYPLKLAEYYLKENKNLILENGNRDPDAMRFGNVEIPRLIPESGGYAGNPSIYGIQTLINFRRGPVPFTVISASDITQGNVDPALLKDKVVILGITTPSSANYFYSNVPKYSFLKDRLLGIELQAHVTSQILSTVIEGRPLLWTWSSQKEYILIVILGLWGIALGRLSQHTVKNLGALISVTLLLWLISYWVLCFLGLWLPIFPGLLVFVANGLVYTAVSQNERRWQRLVAERDNVIQERDSALERSRTTIEERDTALNSLGHERKRTIEHAFDTIHNGPLQTLADLLRRLRDREITNLEVCSGLESLNLEIRNIGESLRQEAISQEARLYLSSDLKLDLTIPLHELFYEVYIATLDRDFPGFLQLQVQVRAFDPIEDETLSIDDKRKLCIFLQEALCNVGKHAVGATRLTVTGKVRDNLYTLTIIDNGAGFNPTNLIEGEGTKIGRDAESQLGGKFIRRLHSPKGTLCQLTFSLIP